MKAFAYDQYAPALLPYIKMQVDSEKKTGAFWLTGSQQFQMMKGITESLAGRVAIINLLGFSNREREKREHKVEPFLPTQKNINQRSLPPKQPRPANAPQRDSADFERCVR